MTTEQSDIDYIRKYLKIHVTNAIEQMSDSQLEVLIKDPLKDFITIQIPQSNQSRPLLPVDVRAMMETNGYNFASPEEWAEFINGLRHSEIQHSITGDKS